MRGDPRHRAPQRRRPYLLLLAIALLALALTAGGAQADEIQIEPAKDTTLFFDDDGELANGIGQHLFTGRGNENKRTMLAFDLASIAPGSVIEEVELTLHLSRTITGGITHEVFRVERDWGEGASDAPGQEGAGGASEPGDATWIHTFFDTETWTSPGGDVAATPSATLLIGDDLGPQLFSSTPELVADVQGWVDDPADNFGWQVRGLESFLLRSAKRFDSREHPDPARRPRLRVVFTPPPVIEIPTLRSAGLAALATLLLAIGLARLRRS